MEIKLKFILLTTCLLSVHLIDLSQSLYLKESDATPINLLEENEEQTTVVSSNTKKDLGLETTTLENKASNENIDRVIVDISNTTPSVTPTTLQYESESVKNITLREGKLENKDELIQNQVQNLTFDITSEIPTTELEPFTTPKSSVSTSQIEADSTTKNENEHNFFNTETIPTHQEDIKIPEVTNGEEIEKNIEKTVRDEINSEIPIDQNILELLNVSPSTELKESVGKDILSNGFLQSTEVNSHSESGVVTNVQHESVEVDDGKHTLDSTTTNYENNVDEILNSSVHTEVDNTENKNIESLSNNLEDSHLTDDVTKNDHAKSLEIKTLPERIELFDEESEVKTVEQEHVTKKPEIISTDYGVEMREGKGIAIGNSNGNLEDVNNVVSFEHTTNHLLLEEHTVIKSENESDDEKMSANVEVLSSSVPEEHSKHNANLPSVSDFEHKTEVLETSNTDSDLQTVVPHKEIHSTTEYVEISENSESTTASVQTLSHEVDAERNSGSLESEIIENKMITKSVDEATTVSPLSHEEVHTLSQEGESNESKESKESSESDSHEHIEPTKVTTEENVTEKVEKEEAHTVQPQNVEEFGHEEQNTKTVITSTSDSNDHHFEEQTSTVKYSEIESIESVTLNVLLEGSDENKDEKQSSEETSKEDKDIKQYLDKNEEEKANDAAETDLKDNSKGESSESSSSEEDKDKLTTSIPKVENKKEKDDSSESNEDSSNESSEIDDNIKIKPQGRSLSFEKSLESDNSFIDNMLPAIDESGEIEHHVRKKPSVELEFDENLTPIPISSDMTDEPIIVNPRFKVILPTDETEKMPRLTFETTTLLPMRIFKSNPSEPVRTDDIPIATNFAPRTLQKIQLNQPQQEKNRINQILETESTTRLIAETITEGVELSKEINRNMNLFLDSNEKNRPVSSLNSENYIAANDEIVAESNVAEALSNKDINSQQSSMNTTLVLLICISIIVMIIAVIVVTFFRFRTPQGVLDIEMQEQRNGKDSIDNDDECRHDLSEDTDYNYHCCKRSGGSSTPNSSVIADETLSHTISLVTTTTASSSSSKPSSLSSSGIKRSVSDCRSDLSEQSVSLLKGYNKSEEQNQVTPTETSKLISKNDNQIDNNNDHHDKA